MISKDFLQHSLLIDLCPSFWDYQSLSLSGVINILVPLGIIIFEPSLRALYL